MELNFYFSVDRDVLNRVLSKYHSNHGLPKSPCELHENHLFSVKKYSSQSSILFAVSNR